MQDKPELSIIIVSYNVRQLLLNCIQSIIDTTANINYEIIVVDNASNDGSALAVKERFPELQVIANKENVGFASANNQGYAVSKGDFLLLLNPDTVVKPDAIKSVLEFMKSTPDAGMAGCRLLNPDGTLQKSIRRFPSVLEHIGRAFFVDRFIFSEHRKGIYYRTLPFEIDYCAGAFMMIFREALGNMPLLSPEFFMYAEEKDLALRLREKGWKTYFVPFGEVIHFGEQSTKQMAVKMFLELQKSQILFFFLHFNGFHRWLMICSWWFTLTMMTVVYIPLVLSRNGWYRLKLFFIAVYRYPSVVFAILRRQNRVIMRFPKIMRIVKEMVTLSGVTIHMFGDPASKEMYRYFTSPHPRYKIIQNKRWGVALMELPKSMEEYLSGKHREYLRRMRNKALRERYRFGTADPTQCLDDMLAINMSAPFRQGRPISPGYLDRESLRIYFTGKKKIYCVFDRDGIMTAYAHAPVVGDVCILDRLLGHSQDLDKGIMYLLVSEIVREIIILNKSMGRPNWMEYDTFFGGSAGIRYFKEKLGFMPYKVRWIWSDTSEGTCCRDAVSESLNKTLL